METQAKLAIIRAKYSEKYAALKADEMARQRAAAVTKQEVVACHAARMNELLEKQRKLAAEHQETLNQISAAEHAAQERYAKAVLDLKRAENEEINQITKEANQ